MGKTTASDYSVDPPTAKDELSDLLINNRCRQILIRDLKHCLACGACERSCERRHGEQRWRDLPIGVDGSGKFAMMPVCQGCETPACVTACLQQAFTPAGTSPQVDAEKCIGCGRCVLACPFAAISCLPPVQKNESDGCTPLARKKAVKCDGCADFAQRACLRECPTGALKVVGWGRFKQLQQKIPRPPLMAATLLKILFRPSSN